jgi:hypothetical protein
MQFTCALVVACALTLSSIPVATAKCIQSPAKRAGDPCESQNKGALSCGPGADGNLVSVWEFHVHFSLMHSMSSLLGYLTDPGIYLSS